MGHVTRKWPKNSPGQWDGKEEWLRKQRWLPQIWQKIKQSWAQIEPRPSLQNRSKTTRGTTALFDQPRPPSPPLAENQGLLWKITTFSPSIPLSHSLSLSLSLSTHLIDVVLALSSTQLLVAGGEFTDKVMAERQTQASRAGYQMRRCSAVEKDGRWGTPDSPCCGDDVGNELLFGNRVILMMMRMAPLMGALKGWWVCSTFWHHVYWMNLCRVL